MIFMLDFSVNMKNCSVPDLLNSVVPSPEFCSEFPFIDEVKKLSRRISYNSRLEMLKNEWISLTHFCFKHGGFGVIRGLRFQKTV